MALDLRILLNTPAPDRFLNSHWPDTLFVGHGPRSRLRTLLKIGPLKSGRAFVNAWRGTATAWPRLAARDALQTIQARQLSRFHRLGFTLYFTRVEDEVAEVNPFLRRIERDLGLRRGDMTCEAILSRKGAGTMPHFDADCTFNLQIEGRKRWRVSPNAAVSHPHKAGMIGQPLPADMAAYARESYPPSIAADAETFDTKAGSVTFLPHGCWHGTECLADSFAIAFVVPGPKWYQLFAGEVEAELLKVAEARRLSLVGPSASRESAAFVLDQLRTIVNGLDVDRLLKRWAGPPSFQFHRRSPAPTHATQLKHAELKPLLGWVKRGAPSFSAFDAIDAFPTADSAVILKGLFTLVDAGVLELE